MSNAIAGHGATIAMELDPSGAQGTFTVIAELSEDIVTPDLMRVNTEVTPHQDTIDSHVMGILKRGELQFGVNYIYNDSTHDHLTGFQYAILNDERRGYRLLGPNGSANTDEWIVSGNVATFGPIQNPVREGARTARVAIRLSGPMIVDGVAYGSVS